MFYVEFIRSSNYKIIRKCDELLRAMHYAERSGEDLFLRPVTRPKMIIESYHDIISQVLKQKLLFCK